MRVEHRKCSGLQVAVPLRSPVRPSMHQLSHIVCPADPLSAACGCPCVPASAFPRLHLLLFYPPSPGLTTATFSLSLSRLDTRFPPPSPRHSLPCKTLAFADPGHKALFRSKYRSLLPLEIAASIASASAPAPAPSLLSSAGRPSSASQIKKKGEKKKGEEKEEKESHPRKSRHTYIFNLGASSFKTSFSSHPNPLSAVSTIAQTNRKEIKRLKN